MPRPSLDPRLNAFRGDLADARLDGRVKALRFVEGEPAQVIRPVVQLRRRAGPGEPLDTEAVFGETLRVFETAASYCWVQLDRDGYVGYLPADALSRQIVEPTHRVSALATFVYPGTDIKAPPLLQLPLGATVRVTGQDERFATIALTDGFSGRLVARHLAAADRPAHDFVDVAERFIGTPYLWGGRTRHGLDCSGLLQTALESAGVAAPRDSDMQQAALGTEVLIPSDLEGLERGDLVFWPGHVGIMVDGVMLLHANAHHMAVAAEPLVQASDRIARTGLRISAVRRLAKL